VGSSPWVVFLENLRPGTAPAMGFFNDPTYAPLDVPRTDDMQEREATSLSSSTASSSTCSGASSFLIWSPDSFKKAIISGNASEVQQMIRNKADINHKYQDGLTPLHFAAIHNQVEVTRALKNAGADCLAETTDGNDLTAGTIALVSGHTEVVEVIGQENARDINSEVGPVTKIIGPTSIAILVAIDYIFFQILDDDARRWDGYREGPVDLGHVGGARTLGYTMLAISMSLLVFVSFTDPGVVTREEVAFVQQLRELPAESLMVIGSDTFSVLKDGDPDPEHTYKWCATCELWRPPGVSHCSTCKHCFWRFDHHCIFIGNCVALRNHRFFALALVLGATAWIMGDISVLQRLINHGALDSLDAWWPPRPGVGMIYLSFLYLLFGLVVLALLVPFAIFHTGSLIGSYTTKSIWSPTRSAQKLRFNSPKEMREICCLPPRCHPEKPCGDFCHFAPRFGIRGRAGELEGVGAELAKADQLSELS